MRDRSTCHCVNSRSRKDHKNRPFSKSLSLSLFIHSQFTGCCTARRPSTARGSSMMFFLVGPTKVKTCKSFLFYCRSTSLLLKVLMKYSYTYVLLLLSRSYSVLLCQLCISTSSCLLLVKYKLCISTSSWVLLITYTLYLITIMLMH